MNINTEFANALAQCNVAQREAVEHIEGPVLVIAGPGTGKTQILSLRIGKILQDTDTQPQNILCLTYTDSGTVAMRKRLLNLIGPVAYQVHIHTFHSFCNSVIQENKEYFGGTQELQPISELETIELYYKLIDGFKEDNRLKKYTGDIYSNLTRLKDLFDTIKKENLNIEHLIQKADQYIESLPLNPEYQYQRPNATKGIKKGDLKLAAIQKEQSKMEDLKAATLQYTNFQTLMSQTRRYDFYDMINWVINAFKTHDGLLAIYQVRYLYFLIDEFQDTNGSQIEILHLLTDFWDAPNLFTVGDDDQSVYSFQGAENERIKEFVETYKSNLYPIVLSENYRSTNQILSAAQTIIQNNFTRLINDDQLKRVFENQNRTLHKNLVSFYKERQGEVKIIEYFNTYHEAADIVLKIEELWQKEENLSETAIIYRNHKNVENIIKVLEQKGIPYNARVKVNILDLPFVQKILTILQYLNLQTESLDKGDYLLFEILHYNFFNISHRDILLITKEANSSKKSFSSIIANKQIMFKLGLESASAISSLADTLSHLQKEIYNVTLQVLLQKVLSKARIFNFTLQSEQKIELLQVLNVLFNFIKTESSKDPAIKLNSFMDMISKMQKNRICIELDKVAYSRQGVNLITAHASKGLEFKNVFLISCSSDCWEGKSAPSNKFKIPPLTDTPTLKSTQRDLEEERRLFYVALTRARQNLYISYPSMKISDKDIDKPTIDKSVFVAEILENKDFQIEKCIKENNEVIEFTIASLQESPPPKIEEIEPAYIDEVLKNYKLNVTQLNKYLRCKLSFYFENILNVPQPATASMSFGKAIHYSLEKLFQKMLQDDHKHFPTKETFFRYFEKAMELNASGFTPDEALLKSEYARKVLPAYYDHYIQKWNKVVVAEYRLNNINFENIPLNGMLDKIEFNGNAVNVVDYKTGTPDPVYYKQKLSPPKALSDNKNAKYEEVYGGDYWRQIIFYKILMDNDRSHNWEMVSGEIDFVQPNKQGEFIKESVYVTSDHINIVKQQIKDTYHGIMNHDFYTGCGKKDCPWCCFVKEHYQFSPSQMILENDEDELL